MDTPTIIKYSVAVRAGDELVTRYDWLASSPEQAVQEVEAALDSPLAKQYFINMHPQAKGAALTFEATVGGNGH